MSYLSANKIHHGRSEQLISYIEPASVALSFWSPPYFVGKDYERDETFDSWQSMLRSVVHGHKRVLKPGGFMVINISDILAFPDPSIPPFQAENPSLRRSSVTREDIIEAIKRHPEYTKRQIAEHLGCSEQTIDRRLRGNNSRGGKTSIPTRVKLVGHYLERYAYEVGLYLYDKRIWKKDPTWASSKWTITTLRSVNEVEDLYVFWKPGVYTINRDRLTPEEWREWGHRQIWEIRSVRKNDVHEAMFPEELAERVIRLYTEPGDTVLDPFVGSGTTAAVAKRLGRNWIGIDKEERYVVLSQQRVDDTPSSEILVHGAKETSR